MWKPSALTAAITSSAIATSIGWCRSHSPVTGSATSAPW